MVEMRGKQVLITGAARGIGLATAGFFAAAGSRLLISDRDSAELARAAEQLRRRGAEVEEKVVDVTDQQAVEALAVEMEERNCPVDVLINNAGVGHHGTLAATTIETWRRLIDINLMGALYHIYAFLPAMRRRGRGHIVNISSGQAYFKLPTWGAYSAVKAALGSMSETLHFELRRWGIWVTTVYPFLARTAFYDHVETRSAGARLSMKLLPYAADSPEKVGRLIFDAVRKRKRVERINLINDLGLVAQVIPGMLPLVSRAANTVLSEKD